MEKIIILSIIIFICSWNIGKIYHGIKHTDSVLFFALGEHNGIHFGGGEHMTIHKGRAYKYYLDDTKSFCFKNWPYIAGIHDYIKSNYTSYKELKKEKMEGG